MNILVAGGSGFIGSHLCLALLKKGHSVSALDNLFTGSKSNLDECFKYPPLGDNSFQFVECDISHQPSWWYGKVDYIYHLASPASPKWYQSDPFNTIKANVFGAFNLAELAKVKKCPIFFSSTSEVYGDPKEHPQKESYLGNVNCVGPRSNYDESKRCAETIFYEYNRQYGVDTKIARFFNTYGPNMALDDGRVVSNFIVAALKGDDLVINGDGSQTRSFMYIDDLIDGIIKFSNSKLHGPINLGNPVEFTIKELAELVIKKTNSTSKIIYAEKLQDDPIVRRPDITFAEVNLDWKPTISLNDGLDRSISYFQERLKSKAI